MVDSRTHPFAAAPAVSAAGTPRAFARPHERPLAAGMRLILLLAGGLVGLIGIPLFLLSEQTDRYFAWTIDPPITAACLGAAYWGSCVLEFLAARQGTWARARVAVPAVLVFTILTLATTLLHIARFHVGASFAPITRAGTYAWILVYALVPPLLTLLWLLQVRRAAVDPPREWPLPLWARAVLVGGATILLTLGLALFVAPMSAAILWPWPLTALTGRALGAWCLGLGIAAAQMRLENDWARIRPGAAGFATLGALELIVLARYPRAVDWAAPGGWLLAAFLLAALLFGGYGIWRGRRAGPPIGSAGIALTTVAPND